MAVYLKYYIHSLFLNFITVSKFRYKMKSIWTVVKKVNTPENHDKTLNFAAN
jgi:hypothetical protein